MIELTQEYLRKYFKYDPGTGDLYRVLLRDRWGNESPTFRKVGTLTAKGYLEASIEGDVRKVHRVIFLYVEGRWPDHVDHINGNRADNRWCNLRDVTRQENMKNRSLNTNNTSGAPGVTWSKQFNKWRARINVNGERISLGLFDTRDEAVAARKGAERLHGYHPNHGRRNGQD